MTLWIHINLGGKTWKSLTLAMPLTEAGDGYVRPVLVERGIPEVQTGASR